MLFLAPVQRLQGSPTVSKGPLDSLPVAAVCWQLYFLAILSTHYPTLFAYLWGIIFFSAYAVLDLSLMDNLCQLLTQGLMGAFLCSQFEEESLQKAWPLIPLHIFFVTLDFNYLTLLQIP